MNTRKLRKVLLTLCSALLLVSLSVGMTIAYLTDTTEVVTNTFTTGKVIIDLDEAKVKEDGTPDGTERVTANSYKLFPGHSYTKDPIVYVGTAKGNVKSENCWLFVKVTNEIADIEAQDATIVSQMTANGWTLVDGETDVYAYKAIAEDGKTYPVFKSFKIDGDKVDNDELAKYADAEITIMAYAIQADGFESAEDAWDAEPCTWTVSETPADPAA